MHICFAFLGSWFGGCFLHIFFTPLPISKTTFYGFEKEFVLIPMRGEQYIYIKSSIFDYPKSVGIALIVY